jgi:PAS domain S-box-containing protein
MPEPNGSRAIGVCVGMGGEPARHAVGDVSIETKQLIHELEVHQLELEMQNCELREARALLEDTCNRYAELYDLAPVAYLTLGRTGRIEEANLTAAAFFGVERGSLAGRLLGSLVAESSRAALREHLAECFTNGIRVSTEIAVRTNRPISTVVQMLSTPVLSFDGKVTACKTTLTDISEVKRGQDLLRFLGDASALFSSSFDYVTALRQVVRQSVPLVADACVADVVDRSGTLQRVEIAARSAEHETFLQALRGRLPEAGPHSVIARVLKTRRSIWSEPASTIKADIGLEHDRLLQVLGSASFMYVPIVAHGAALGVLTFLALENGRVFGPADVATAEDLANRIAMGIESARLYEDARQAIAARDEMLSFVSHDLKNPLTGILLTTASLMRAAPGDERRHGWKQLRVVRRAVEQMRWMVEDLLDLSSIESGSLTIRCAEHEVESIVAEAVALLGPLAKEKGIEIDTELEGPCLRVRCDRERIVRVLSNLAGNAIKFTPKQGRVTVRVEEKAGFAQFVVSDTGPGVSTHMLPRLFQRHVQANETAHKGRGLGLYISRRLVEAHGGGITVENAESGGARFSFALPLCRERGRGQFEFTMTSSEAPNAPSVVDP